LFYDAVNTLEYTAPTVGSVANMIQEGFGHKASWPDQKAIPTFIWGI